jgi:hypothetical protein
MGSRRVQRDTLPDQHRPRLRQRGLRTMSRPPSCTARQPLRGTGRRV